MQNQFNVEYPQNLPDLLQVTKQAFENEARMAMAVKLFELKRVSSGMASELAGCSRVAFLLGLHRFNVPMIGFVFQKREKNLRFFDVTYSPPIPV